ncbi:glutathione hydrolase 1 proenzyme-like [Thrips palmi]|uniref:Glutathione hydrolase 1 proenzyme-like n=1 Tax=Thrips palmi TaxID=161013 RepID=A0A6P8YZL7_THRPL|nr:glutathione hydrolase 1 proenzyme-like [Thrips palmi]
MLQNWSRRTKWLVSIAAAAVIVVVIVLAVVLQPQEDKGYRGAIATDAAPCHEVGERLLRAGGNAVEVTIGILLCEGVSSAQSMGLGGGFLMTIYDRKKKKSYVMVAREPAALAAFEDMYHGNGNLSLYGGMAVAVPAELVGYDVLYKKFGGSLTWAQLVEPTIKICEDGVPIIQYVENIVNGPKVGPRILESPTLSEILAPGGKLLKKGDLMKRTKLADTLRVVAKEGGRALHSGSLTAGFVKDLQDFGSIVTAEDLASYEPRLIEDPPVAPLPGGYKLIAPPPPGSGPLLAHFLMLTADLIKTPLDDQQHQRIVEAMKFVYAARTDFGDQEFVPSAKAKAQQLLDASFAAEIRAKMQQVDTQTSLDPEFYGASWSTQDPQGTAHVSVITEDFAVSVTSTINTEYGSMLVSPSTGIILNNEMDDFSLPGVNSYYGVPPSPANFIRPKKIPQSSMSPSVILDADDNVRMVIGASGGTRIISSAGLVTLYHLYLGMGLDEAIRLKRFHHQLMPMAVQCELGMDEEMKRGFEKYGHQTMNLSRTASSVMAISVHGNKYYPSADARREGVTALIPL